MIGCIWGEPFVDLGGEVRGRITEERSGDRKLFLYWLKRNRSLTTSIWAISEKYE